MTTEECKVWAIAISNNRATIDTPPEGWIDNLIAKEASRSSRGGHQPQLPVHVNVYTGTPSSSRPTTPLNPPFDELLSSSLRELLTQDEALRRYVDWQKSRVKSQRWKDCFEEAFERLDNQCITLPQLRSTEPAWLIERGVVKGTAQMLIIEVKVWRREVNSLFDEVG